MTRRKGFVLLLAALIVVFVIGGVVGVLTTRAGLLNDIDQRLTDNVGSMSVLVIAFPEEIEEFAAEREGGRAVVIVDRNGDIWFERAPGAEDLGTPDLSTEEIVGRSGELFTVAGVGVDHNFRVAVGRLDDGGFLAIAEPLNELRQTLTTLGRILVATLFGVVVVLGLMFSRLARFALQPYDQIIETADAIVDGDLDRRVDSEQPDPDVKRLVGSINRMLDRNQDALAARIEAEERVTRFAAEASHELRTPLATIAGYSEVYLSGASTDPDSVEKQMSRINGEATRLGRLVEAMLTITRLDNEVGFESEALNLADVARAAVADAAFSSTDHDAAERLSLDEGEVGSLIVDGDRDSLYQVLANLLANAEVHAPAAEVVVMLGVNDGHGVITVSDDGPGMPQHVAENAFNRFYRGSPTSDSGIPKDGPGTVDCSGHRQSPWWNYRLGHNPRGRNSCHHLAATRSPGPTVTTWKKVGLGVAGVVVVVAVLGGLWLSDLLSFDTSDEAGVSFSTVESVVPDVLSCLNNPGESEDVAKELINLDDDVVVINAGVDRLMSDADWEDYSPRLPWSKNVNRNTTFTDHCFYRSPSVPADCVGDACRVVVEHDGFDWIELSIVRSQDCLPNDDAGCSVRGVDPGAISVTVASKCHRVVWEDEIVELADPDGNRYVLHATETGEVDFGVELPDGWRLETVVLDEPLVVTPFGGGDNCYHNVLRDNAGQGYHQYVFASSAYPATS